MDLDAVLNEVGQFGRYQIYMYFLLFYLMLYSVPFSLSFVFTAANLHYRCFIPECESKNATKYMAEWVNTSVPFHNDAPAQCVKYAVSNWTANCSTNSLSNSTERCHQFVFETEETTVLTEFDLMCEENVWRGAFAGTVNSVGQLIGMIPFGILSDKYGRKLALVHSVVLTTAMGLMKSFASSYTSFVVFEFLDAAVASGTYSAAFILGLEIICPEMRVLASSILSTMYSVGSVLLGVIAWYFPDWRLFLRVTYFPGVLSVLFYWLLPESIRWLMTNRKYDEARHIIYSMSAMNRKPLSEKTKSQLNSLGEPAVTELGVNESGVEKSGMKAVLRSKIMMFRIAVISFNWAAINFIYYGISLNSVTIDGNKHMNFILSGLAEIPAYFITWLYLDNLGRKASLWGSLFLTSFVLVLFTYLPEDLFALRQLAYMSSKMVITIAFTVLYVHCAELFPTSVRHSVLGTCSMLARTGTIMAPAMPLISPLVNPIYIFAIFSFLAGLSVLFLPETQGIVLPDTMEEAKMIGKKPNIRQNIELRVKHNGLSEPNQKLSLIPDQNHEQKLS